MIGGTGAVSTSVEEQLKVVAPTDRVAGLDRYDTAAQVALDADGIYRTQDLGVDPIGVQTLYVVGGANFPDALAAGAATGSNRGAIVLTKRDHPPRAVRPGGHVRRAAADGRGGRHRLGVRQRRRPTEEPSPRVPKCWRAGRRPLRHGGRRVRERVRPPGPGIMLANGSGFSDALSAAAFGTVVEYPLLLSRSTCAPAPTVAEAASYAAVSVPPIDVVGVGGPGVLSDAALALKPC